MELVRLRAERCDSLEGIVVHMSVAGGTGSGLGTRLTELLKDACVTLRHRFSDMLLVLD